MESELDPIEWSAVEALMPRETPTFKPGDTVWVIHEREPQELTVQSVLLTVCEHKKKFAVLCMGYNLGLCRSTEAGPTPEYPPFMVYATAEEAGRDAVWYSTEGIADKVWYSAFGVPHEQPMSPKRRTRFNEHAEFGSCCANVDRIRHLFFDCHREGGMLERDRAALQAWLNAPDCDQVSAHPLSEKPNLAIILSYLKVTVPDPATHAAST